VWRWWRDWRERRAALRDLEESQRREEAVLMDQNLNPLNLAKLSLDSGDPVKAASYWERALVHLPNVILRSPDSLEILLPLGRFDEAEVLMRRRHERFPRDRFYLAGLARIAEQRGDIVLSLKRWEIARNRTRDAVDGYLGCARCLLALGRLDEAEEQNDQVLRRAPDNLYAWAGRARVSDRRGDWQESLARWKHLAEVLEWSPAFAFAAKSLAQLGRVEEADAYLDEPSLLYPRDIEIAVTRAYLSRLRGDLAAVCDRWTSVRSKDPYFIPGYRDGVECLIEAQRHADADAALLGAIERFPDQAWPLLDFARLAHNRGDWTQAVARWASLCQRFPTEEAGFVLGPEALKAAGRDVEAAALHSANEPGRNA